MYSRIISSGPATNLDVHSGNFFFFFYSPHLPGGRGIELMRPNEENQTKNKIKTQKNVQRK